MTEEFKNAKEYAHHLFLATVSVTEWGRPVGYTYEQILEMVHQRFPIITNPGPHQGRPIRMTVKQLREIAYSLQGSNRSLRFPIRPRSPRGPRKEKKSPLN